MKVTFNPADYTYSGMCSLIIWRNPDLHAAIREIIKVQPHEKIKELVIDKIGITAVFEQVAMPSRIAKSQ